MYKHGSINRAFRLVRNEALDCWVPVAEISRGRTKRSGRPAGLLAVLLAMAGAQALAQEVAVAPPVHELPTGGKVVAGSAILTPGNVGNTATLNIDQSTQRAIIDWNTFNVGSEAQVNFNQPGRDAATLNRIHDSNPSQIFGSITSTGQVFLTNASGVYFGKSATADVGSLVATTHDIGNADFMAGNITLNRDGATGSVVNEGELRAAIGGYIAMLAPEVRNSGVIVARLGAVAMASGESITLNLDGHHLTGITVTPSAIAALVENQGAVLAPGGLIVLSAKALDRLQGGVVTNTGTLEATGLSMKGGRIVLEASDAVENSGTINANAGADGSPAGSVEITAPSIQNSGVINAAAAQSAVAGGSISLTGRDITQTASGSLDVSGATGGQVSISATENIAVAGNISAAAVTEPATGTGGAVEIAAGHNVTLQGAVVDASGNERGGQILIAAGGDPAPFDPLSERPTAALIGGTQLRTSSRRGRGGTVMLTGDRVGLFDVSAIDATGATGGGDVYVGGGFHGKDPSIANATQVVVGTHASIDASATHAGSGGNVAVWSDGQTTFGGHIAARGGADAGNGGFVEVSGKENLDFRGLVDAGAAHGAAGTLLLDPKDIIVDALGGAGLTDVDTFADTPAADSTIAPTTITAMTNAGTAVVLQANNDITVNSSIVTINGGGVGGALTFRAGRSITLNGSVSSDDGAISFTLNDAGADGNRTAATDAVFLNNSLIDAGTGTLTITMGTKDQSGSINTGQVTAGTFNIVHDGVTGTAASGAIDLGEITVTGNMGITSAVARDVTNTLGSVIVRGAATISVGAGDVTINRATTDFNFIGLTARNATLADTNAMRFTSTNLSGNLIESAQGPIAQTGNLVVAGTTSLTVTDGGFGYADPYINLATGNNDFGGAVTISAATAGTTGTGGYVQLRDINALNIASANVSRAMTLNAVGGITAGSMTVGTTLNATSTGAGAITLGTTGVTTVGSHATLSSGGAVSLQGTTTVGGTLGIAGQGAVDLSTTTVSGDNLNINTSGAITDSGALTVVNFTYLTAGAANNITLDTATNNFNYLRILSGNNVTLADANAMILGPNGASTISGNLSITAGGSITQYASHENNSPITVGGTSTFTATGANMDLILGPIQQHYIDGWGGAQNSFAGAVTISTSGAGAWRDISIKNVNAGAGIINGLGGGLRDVLFWFDNASSISLPAMTLTGNLTVDATSGGITQTGALVVNNASAGISTFRTGASSDLVLTNAGNDFNRVTVRRARDASFVDTNALDLYTSNVYFNVSRDLNVTAGGAISDSSQGGNLGYYMNIGSAGSGTATFTAGGANNVILDNDQNFWRTVAVASANNLTVNPRNNLVLGNINANGTVSFDSRDGGALSQVGSTAVLAGGNTTFWDFNQGITLSQAGNEFGALAIHNAPFVTIRENDAITQASAWSAVTGSAINLTTSDDQAITLNQANYFGNLTLTQINNGAGSAGAVLVTETADNINGMTQGSAWTLHGATTLNSGNYLINLATPTNVFGPLQVSGATGSTNGVLSTVTIYAQNTASNDAIRDGSGAWNTGNGVVRLIAYNQGGTTAGGGNVNLLNAGNVLGDLYVKATDVTITENGSITDGASTIWNSANDTGWMTTGTTNLIVANPGGKSITLDNLSNQIGPLGLNMTGTAGTLSSVLITDNTDLTQASVWNVGAAPVTLDARNHLINLTNSGNVLGAITINTTNGMPTSIAISENDAITQGAAWIMSGVPVTLIAENDNAITLTNASNILGNLTLTGGAVSITENDTITQAGAWTTTGTTTLNATTNAITLNNANNVLGALAIGGAPSTVGITENDDITQASAWSQGTSAITLNAGTNDVVLSQANNQLGDLTLTAQNATVTENHAAGITDGGAWNIAGTTTLTAGAANAIVLNANPASDFGTVSIVSASNADIADVNGIILGASTIAAGGTLTVTAGGAITQSGAITAPSLRLIGTGSATLTHVANNVGTLAAGFSGGDLIFTNAGTLAIGVVGGTSGVTIGANDVTLTSVNGTVTGLSNINASSTSLAVTTGTALTLPQMSIAGAQTYTSAGGITLGASVTSTAAGAINFMSPVTLAADLSVQSTNSAINFAGTLAGATNQLTVNAGAGAVGFQGAVTNLGSTGDASAALQITSSEATFSSTLSANNGLAITGPVVFSDTVTLANGNAASVFTGLVTLGKVGGMNLSGYDGMTFNGGVLLQNGAATINSNNSALAFQTAGTVSGPYALTLDSGTASLIGLNRMGSNLTSLDVTALSPTIPSGGVSIAGPQSYTATAGSVITLSGNVTSTASGTITFNSPVTVGASAVVTSVDSDVLFAGTVEGNNDLTVSSGSGATTFTGAVGGVAALGDGTGAALTVSGTGVTTFGGALTTRSGITTGGAVNFNGNVTLGNGTAGSAFAGLATSGGAGGNSISGFDGIAFNGGLALTGGAVSVASNGSTLHLGGPVTGAQNLTLNALAGGAGTVTGLDQIGFASTLTGLDVTAQTLDLPGSGLAVAGAMNFTAAGGITLNGAVGASSGPATGAINFNGPVSLATGPITVSTNNAAVNFNGTVNGAQALAVNAGSGVTTFGGAAGATIALASVTTDTGGSTVMNGGSIRTTGAQTYNDAVTLGADSTLTGVDVQFLGTLNGARALIVNDSGNTLFGGIVGGSAALSSITTDAPGTVTVNTTAVTTSGAQTYNENMTLGANAVFTGIGVSFAGIDGTHALNVNAGSGAARFNGALGATTPLTSIAATGNTVAVAAATTTGTQSYTANGGVTLNGDLATTGSHITITGPTTLGADATLATSGGNIVFSGAPSTINGAHDLTLTAGAGDVVLGGVVGGIARLTGIDASGNNLTLPGISTVGDLNQTYTALNHITLNQSRNVNAPISFTADSDNDGAGSFILLDTVSLTASNNTVSIQAADLDLQGNSTMSSGSGLMSITATNGRNLALGGADAAGQMTISGGELARIISSSGLDLNTTGAGWIHVNGIAGAQSQNITGTLGLNAQGTGEVSFLTGASTFNALRVAATGGMTNVGVNLTTTNDPIEFVTAVSVSGASTIASGGGNISFDSTLAVDNDLTLTTGNGVLTFGGAVGSNKMLTLNLGGGSVAGLSQLQSALTGLTVNGTAGITLPALTINGPQVYNTGAITVTGDLSGTGITFNNLVDVVPASGTALTLDAGTGTLDFTNLVSFNATDMTLIGDEINFSRAVTGSGSLALRAFTGNRNTVVGSGGAPIAGLNLTAAELAWLPIGTLGSLTIGNAAGTGSLDLAGVLNAPNTPVTLNGGGGITQSGGSLTSGNLSLHAAGSGISLTSAGNAFGAVGISGSPSALSLTNTRDITQLGAAAWNLGTAPVTLNAGSHDITLNNVGNAFGTLSLTGGEVRVTEAADTTLAASNVSKNLVLDSSGAIDISGALAATGNVSLNAGGVVTQSAPLTIGGNLSVVTSVNAGDVTINNSGAAATSLGNTLVGGNYVLTATGKPVSQAAGASLQVRGDLTVTGASIVLGGAGNLVGGTTSLPATNTVVLRQSGVITLTDRNDTGNLTVISERTNRSFGSLQVGGNAIVLDNAGNSIGGTLSVSASPATIVTGADVQTGINQAAATSIAVAGLASFTAESSSAGSLGINLTNAGNQFGTLQLSGTTVDVANSNTGLTTIENAVASTSLTLTTAGALSQNGSITAPVLVIDATGPVTLNHAANDAASLDLGSAGGAISYVDANGISVTALDAGGGDVSLTAGGIGNLTQTGALLDVGALSANAGGAVTLTNAGNSLTSLATSSAGTGFQLVDIGGLAVTGLVRTVTGDLTLRTAGDLTLNTGSRLQGDAGDVLVSTEGAGNFDNDAGSNALLAGTGKRWLVYSNTPDLAAGAHTDKGGLTSSFRHYGATFATYAPGSVTQSGNGFIYRDAAPTLTVSAAIAGSATHVYGDTPTGSLTYAISAGLLDSEDNAGNVITGGTATFSSALANTMDAGSYSIGYTGGLVSNYTLVGDPTGAAYTVTPATLTYTAGTASRVYGEANPALGGSIGGFKLGQDATVLGGGATWTTTAVAGSNVGQYAITGAGYTASNYTFAQAAGNATAFNVTRAGLTVTVNGDARTYDGTGYSGGAGVTYSGFANSEGAGALGGALVYGGSAQGARNAGNYNIAASGLTSGNYDINYVDGTLAIARANLTLTPNAVTKTYDGTLTAVGSATATGGTQLFGSDTATGGTFTFANANAGSGNRTVSASGVTVNDGNGGANYLVSYLDNTTSTIDRANIAVASGNVTKTYDGTLSANGTATLVAGSLFSNASNGNVQDALSGGSFAFTNANAGAGNKTVTASGVTVSDGNGGGNYLMSYVDNNTSTINRAALSFSGTIADKTYDGSTSATLAGYSLTGFVGSETVNATAGSADFADQNAGTGKTVNLGGIALSDGTNGGLASNYLVAPTATATGTIDPRLLTLDATVADRVYDGTTNAVVESYGLSGFVGSETVTGILTGSARFADKHVGTDKGISITGIVLLDGTNGGLASNYLAPTSATSSADITAATLHVAGVVALDKVYDGTTLATLDTRSAGVAGVFGSDEVSIGSITGTFLDKNVGADKAIGAGTVVLSGADAGDYVLVQPTGLTASITPRALLVTATAHSRVYDATTGVDVDLADNRIAGDLVAINSSNSFLDKNVGAGKFVDVSGIAISGADAGNYSVNGSTSAFADITRATLAVTATGADKVYDGTTAANVLVAGAALAGDSVSLSFDSAAFGDKNAGTDKAVSVTGIRGSGADAGNYNIVSTAATTADIAAATLTVGAVGASKPYDGTTAASVTLTDDRIAGDQLTLENASAAFADANVGNGKQIDVGGIRIAGGADSGNYVLASDATSATADISGPLATGSSSTWSLPPSLPQPVAPVAPQVPAPVLDATLPATFGSGAGNPDSQTVNAAPTMAGAHVVVSVVRAPSNGSAGAVSVAVPEQFAAPGMSFSFALPAEVLQSGDSGPVRVTLGNGASLPSWLRYLPREKTIVANATPAGALPLEVLVRIGDRSWVLQISGPKRN